MESKDIPLQSTGTSYDLHTLLQIVARVITTMHSAKILSIPAALLFFNFPMAARISCTVISSTRMSRLVGRVGTEWKSSSVVGSGQLRTASKWCLYCFTCSSCIERVFPLSFFIGIPDFRSTTLNGTVYGSLGCYGPVILISFLQSTLVLTHNAWSHAYNNTHE